MKNLHNFRKNHGSTVSDLSDLSGWISNLPSSFGILNTLFMVSTLTLSGYPSCLRILEEWSTVMHHLLDTLHFEMLGFLLHEPIENYTRNEEGKCFSEWTYLRILFLLHWPTVSIQKPSKQRLSTKPPSWTPSLEASKPKPGKMPFCTLIPSVKGGTSASTRWCMHTMIYTYYYIYRFLCVYADNYESPIYSHSHRYIAYSHM